jgi:hypothetical protein
MFVHLCVEAVLGVLHSLVQAWLQQLRLLGFGGRLSWHHSVSDARGEHAMTSWCAGEFWAAVLQ